MRFWQLVNAWPKLRAHAENLFHLGFAGDTFNTCWYLARLRPNHNVAFFTAWGDDALSGQMQGFFKKSGVDTAYVRTIPNHTIGLYMITLNNGERSFSYWRGNRLQNNWRTTPLHYPMRWTMQH